MLGKEGRGKKRKSPRARCAGVGGGILNLGGSIDFTIWTPPKVKNKPSRTYSTLIECLSSARLVSTHRPERERGRREERNRGTGGGRRGGAGEAGGGRAGGGGENRRGEERGCKRGRVRHGKGVIKREGGRRAGGEKREWRNAVVPPR